MHAGRDTSVRRGSRRQDEGDEDDEGDRGQQPQDPEEADHASKPTVRTPRSRAVEGTGAARAKGPAARRRGRPAGRLPPHGPIERGQP